MKFVPRFVPKMWGGRKLQQIFGKSLPGEGPYGESWEVFDFPPGATGPDAIQAGDDDRGWISATIANGPLAGTTLHQIMVAHPASLLGQCAAVDTPHGGQFPLLIKFLDARDDLSVQVHPPPAYVSSHSGAHLKNEAWHILHCDPGARLLLGARKGVTRAIFEQALRAGTAEKEMNSVAVLEGETYYMPSGTLHALGGGIVAYEVQTPSDTTYRVFDFSRIDPSTGKPRTLHVEQALDCIQFHWDALQNKTPRQPQHAIVAQAPQWILMQIRLSAGAAYELNHDAGPIVATCVSGGGSVQSFGVTEEYTLGETIVLPPAESTRLRPARDSTLLLAGVPPVDRAQLLPRSVA